MSEPFRLLEVGELDFTFEPSRWPFAQRRAAGIAAHWARLMKAKPALFNGRVLLLGRRKVEAGENGALTLSGAFFETDYADFLAWEEFGERGEAIDNCFSMAALHSADGAFLLTRSLRGPATDAARIGIELGASLRADSPRDIFS